MSDKQVPGPRKRPQQQRSMQLVRAIKEACLKILQQEGPDQLTTQRIADVAGVTIGSLYQYFPNKESVLADVFQQQISDDARDTLINARFIEQLAGQSLEQTLRAVIELEIEQLLRYYRLDPVFFRQYQQQFNPLATVEELTIEWQQPSMDDWFASLLQRHSDRLHSDKLELASFIALRALNGVLVATVEEQPELLESEEFREQLVQLLLRYLCR